MNDGNENPGQPVPFRLSQRQLEVVQALQSRETERYRISQWYLGALYALDNHYNPDRISQAAHSLRELMEKLPRVVLESDWFEKRGRPSRREQGQLVIEETDPLSEQMDAKIREAKRDGFHQLRKRQEEFAHHGRTPDVKEFADWLELLERAILNLLAPISAQDQQEIQSLLNQPERSGDDIERLFTLIERRGANYTFFFDQATDPSWIPFLMEREYFSNPPGLEQTDSGQIDAPYWWPIHYLSKVALEVPDEVVGILLGVPRVDNPRVKVRILEIARQLPGAQSIKLKPRVLDLGTTDLPFLGHWYYQLLAHWVEQDEIEAALELTAMLVQFEPDPQLENKRNRYLELGIDWSPPVEPVPRLGEWEYREMFETGIRPLAEKHPYAVARVLAEAADEMVQLRTQEEPHSEVSDDDLSEVWCRRLGQVDDNYEQSSNVLLEGLTLACERVFGQVPGSVAELDECLRSKRWAIFKRLRQHLYALFPTEKTKPWIREFLLGKDDYPLWTHRYEFQQMVRSACEHFGDELLTEEERERIFDAILSGPPKERYIEQWGDGFSEELFKQRRRHFHRMQLNPFSAILSGTYSGYYRELNDDGGQDISDDNYLLFGDVKGGAVRPQSPRPSEELATLTDTDLLDYINQWNEEHSYEIEGSGDEWLVEVNIEALADAFKGVFRESILPDNDRLGFWMEHLEEIERTIFVRAMVNAMEDHVKEGKVDKLDRSLAICEWVLSHPDQDPTESFRYGEQSRGALHWHSSRRAVGDFVEACIKAGADVTGSTSHQLTKLLDALCTEFDWSLDNNQPVLLDRDEPFTEAINNTRSRALGSLVKFGLWLRENDPETDISFVLETLEKRFSQDAEFRLAPPEQAILGVNYGGMLGLDAAWTVAHEADLFPQHDLDRWRAAFGSLLHFTRPHSQIFKALRGQFIFAVENLPYPEAEDSPRSSLTDKLGQHLFIYYLWGVYPLNGEYSLLERFFQETSSKPERWGALFKHVGFILRNAEHLDEDPKDRFMEFFEWRLEQGSPEELKEFWFWLESECLDAEWRLDAFSRTLNIARPDSTDVYGEVETLDKLLPDHPGRVVECFAKLTDNIENDTFNIQTEPAKRILKIGLESTEEDVRKNAGRAHENLLKRGRSDLLDLGD